MALYPSGRHADEHMSEDAPTRIMNLPPFPPRQKSVPIDDEIFDRVAEELRERPDLEEEAYCMRTAPNYDQTTRHEMMWQAAEARLQQHHDWGARFGSGSRGCHRVLGGGRSRTGLSLRAAE